MDTQKQLLLYYKYRTKFELDIFDFFKSINFSDYTHSGHMFFFNNVSAAIGTITLDYDYDFENKKNIYTIESTSEAFDDYNHKIIFQNENYSDFISKLQTLKVIQLKMRNHKLKRLIHGD